jgi:hypothetical protein
VNYQVWGLDVWGNEEDGFTVNNRYRAGKIRVPEKWTERHFIKALIEAGLFKRGVTTKDVSFVWGDEDYFDIEDAKTGEPVFQLEKIGGR